MRTCLAAAVITASGAFVGCATTEIDKGDGAVPPDGDSSRDSASDSTTEVDAGLAPHDAPSDSPAGPVACTPAACDPPDGGTETYQPPWGCPEACEPGCVGDTVCCEDGTCQQRMFHPCDDGCDVEMTVRSPGLAWQCGSNFEMWADICNRGTTVEAAPGQVVRFESELGTECDAVTTAPIPPCSCIRASCEGSLRGSFITPLLNPDAPLPECGSPWGHVGSETAYQVYCE
jgi:hypothetical protein